MPDSPPNPSASLRQARPAARPFRYPVLTALLGMTILMPLRVPAAESLPAPLDSTRILRLVYPGAVLPAEVSEALEGRRETPIATPPEEVVGAIDGGTAADSPSKSVPSDAALAVAVPNDTAVPVAQPSAAVSSAPAAMPPGVPASEPAALNKDTIAALASGNMQPPGKPAEPPLAGVAPTAAKPDSPPPPKPSPNAIAPEAEAEPEQAPTPTLGMPDSRSPQQAMLPEARFSSSTWNTCPTGW